MIRAPTRKHNNRFLLLALLVVLRPAAAQAPEQKGVIKITVNLVQVDATVTDSKGRQVTDLKAENFVVFEDGKPRPITNFSYVRLEPAPQPPPTAAPRPAPEVSPRPLAPSEVRRTLAIVVDDLGLSFASIYYVRGALRKFVDAQVEPGDLVAIVRTGEGMGVLQQFTSDRRLLYAAIDPIRWLPWGGASASSFSPDLDSRGWSTPRTSSPTSRGGGSGPSLGASSGPGEDVFSLRQRGQTTRAEDYFRQEIFTAGTLGALNYVLRGMGELPGRKSVILVSDGIPMTIQGEFAPELVEAFHRLTDLANRSSVVIYTLDARGLPVLGLEPSDRLGSLSPFAIANLLSKRRETYFDSLAGMEYLSLETGGFCLYNDNDLSHGIGRILDDQRGYYLLGFTPSEKTFAPGRPDYHRIQVKVNVKGLRVRSRKGFFGIPDEAMRPGFNRKAEPMVAALTSPFVSADIHVRLTGLYGDDPQPRIHFLMHVEPRDLAFEVGPGEVKKMALDVLAVSFGDNGAIASQLGREITAELSPPQYQLAMENGLSMRLDVPVPKPGGYQLRAVVRDQNSRKIGSANCFIEVPDVPRNGLAMSGLELGGALRPLAASPAGAQVIDPFGAASPARRQFRAGNEFHYAYEIYHFERSRTPRTFDLEARLRILHDGKTVYEGPPQKIHQPALPKLNRIFLEGTVHTGSGFSPGEYVLEVSISEKSGKKARLAVQWADFEIVP